MGGIVQHFTLNKVLPNNKKSQCLQIFWDLIRSLKDFNPKVSILDFQGCKTPKGILSAREARKMYP